MSIILNMPRKPNDFGFYFYYMLQWWWCGIVFTQNESIASVYNMYKYRRGQTMNISQVWTRLRINNNMYISSKIFILTPNAFMSAVNSQCLSCSYISVCIESITRDVFNVQCSMLMQTMDRTVAWWINSRILNNRFIGSVATVFVFLFYSFFFFEKIVYILIN